MDFRVQTRKRVIENQKTFQSIYYLASSEKFLFIELMPYSHVQDHNNGANVDCFLPQALEVLVEVRKFKVERLLFRSSR